MPMSALSFMFLCTQARILPAARKEFVSLPTISSACFLICTSFDCMYGASAMSGCRLSARNGSEAARRLVDAVGLLFRHGLFLGLSNHHHPHEGDYLDYIPVLFLPRGDVSK